MSDVIDSVDFRNTYYELVPELTPVTDPLTNTVTISRSISDNMSVYDSSYFMVYVNSIVSGSITTQQVYETSKYIFLKITGQINTSLSLSASRAFSSGYWDVKNPSTALQDITFITPINGSIKVTYSVYFGGSDGHHGNAVVARPSVAITNTTNVDETLIAKPRLYMFYNNSESLLQIPFDFQRPDSLQMTPQSSQTSTSVRSSSTTQLNIDLIYCK